MICPEARLKLQELFSWWKNHVEHHTCVGCSMARLALTAQGALVKVLGKEGVNV